MIRVIAFVLFLAVFVATLAPHGSPSGGFSSTTSTTTTTTTDTADSPVAHDVTSTTTGPQPIASAARELVIERSPDGHFYTDAQVGAATIHFLIDTGATTIALSRADAQAAGVQYAASDQAGIARTANGEVGFKRVTLDRVAIGPFETHDVDASVIDTPMDVSLLGQSWLRNVGTVTISGDKMTLK